MTTTTTMKPPVELAAWLLRDACERVNAQGIDVCNDALFSALGGGEAGVFENAHDTLSDGDTVRAAELLREAVRLAGEPVPTIKDGRNRAERQRRAQYQRERLLNVAQIALRLLELMAAATPPASTPAINLMAAADAAETFARTLRAAAGQEGGAA